MPPLTSITSQSPGVYVSEERSAAPIAGVGTSTAGFIGIVGSSSTTTQDVGSATDLKEIAAANAQDRTDTQTRFKLPHSNVVTGSGFGFYLGNSTTPVESTKVKIENNGNESFVTFTGINPPSKDVVIKGYYKINVPSAAATTDVQLCTNFSEFKTFWKSFLNKSDQLVDDVFVQGQSNLLAHAVFGFFRNGGTRCYVVGIAADNDGAVQPALDQFEAIDEIAIVAAPGLQNVRLKVKEHCEEMKDRVAILDPPATAKSSDPITTLRPFNSESGYAAIYFPWLLVFDPTNPQVSKPVPPSGHIAGIYARVDGQRGVFKAPANEVIAGAVGLAQPISKSQQDRLNPEGINCIRNFNGNIRVWGARTMAPSGSEFKYISTRRLFNYLRESIDEGTQWTVFEPNSPELWARIRRSVTAFLTVVWRSGALFGSTPEEAFYVKCDAENNPPEQREQGLVVTDIGVAIVKPAEFVVFRLSQRQEGQ